MKILMLSNYYPEHQGGIETVAGGLAASYRQHGHRVRWLAADEPPHAHQGHLDDVPLPAWNVAERRLGFPYPLPAPASLRTIRQEVEDCEVVHLHDCLYAANVRAYAAARRLHKPLLITQHVAAVPYRNPALRVAQAIAYRTLGKALLGGAAQVVFVSEVVRDAFRAGLRYRRPPEVVENGIDTDLFRAADPELRSDLRRELGVPVAARLLLFVGRFVEKKGLTELREVAEMMPEWSWILVGRSGDQDPGAWGLPNLRVLGPTDSSRLRDLYLAADLLVLPSRGEGFPVVVQEAMACGTPAVVGSETLRAVPAAASLLFGAPRGSAGLRDVTAAALGTLDRSPGIRDEVSAFAHARWGRAACAARYEELLVDIAADGGDDARQGQRSS